MKNRIYTILFKVFYILSVIPMSIFAGYEIFRVKSIDSPFSFLPIAFLVTSTAVYSLITKKEKKNAETKNYFINEV